MLGLDIPELLSVSFTFAGFDSPRAHSESGTSAQEPNSIQVNATQPNSIQFDATQPNATLVDVKRFNSTQVDQTKPKWM